MTPYGYHLFKRVGVGFTIVGESVYTAFMVQIRFNKLAQQYFFISTLTAWHFSCNQEHRALWLKRLPPLSKNDKDQLKKIAKIFKKYGFNSVYPSYYLGSAFYDYPQNRVWKQVQVMTSQEDYLIIQEIFQHFQASFDTLWDESVGKLSKIAEKMIALSESPQCKKIEHLLQCLFGVESIQFDIVLLLVPEGAQSIGGSANTNQHVITVEINHLRRVTDALLIAYHEYAHHLWKSLRIRLSLPQNMRGQIKKIPMFNTQGISSAWEEYIIRTLLPDGYLATKMITRPKPADAIEKRVITQARPLIIQYLQEQKPIDKTYAYFVLDYIVDSKDKGGSY